MIDLKKKYPFRKKHCETCPFSNTNGCQTKRELQNRVITRIGLESSQLCHHPRKYGKTENQRCYGASLYQARIMHGLGLLKEPTVEQLEKEMRETLGEKANF